MLRYCRHHRGEIGWQRNARIFLLEQELGCVTDREEPAFLDLRPARTPEYSCQRHARDQQHDAFGDASGNGGNGSVVQSEHGNPLPIPPARTSPAGLDYARTSAPAWSIAKSPSRPSSSSRGVVIYLIVSSSPRAHQASAMSGAISTARSRCFLAIA